MTPDEEKEYFGRKFQFVKVDLRRKGARNRLNRPFILVDAEQEAKPQLGLSHGFVHFKSTVEFTDHMWGYCGVAYFFDQLEAGRIAEIID